MDERVRPALRPIPEIVSLLETGELRSAELTDDCLRRIHELDGDLNVFLHVDESGARRAAEEADGRHRRGEARSPLDGVPFALKANIVSRGLPASCASRILEGFVSPYDATAVRRLRDAGAVLLGSVNLDEFAMGSSNEHSAFGPTRNPHDPERVPGGSSGGPCAAVSAGMAPLALGSDTGGSVRLPASFCGVVGMKPTYGRVSRYGLVAFGSSLDQIGPIARTVNGCALALAAIAGADPCDATSLRYPVPELASGPPPSVEGMRIGVVPELLGEGVDEQVLERVQRAAKAFEEQGARIVEVAMPHLKYGVAAYYVVASAEASSNLARYDGARYGWRAPEVSELDELYTQSRSRGFGDEVKRRIMIGTFTLSAGYYDRYYGRAMTARSHIRSDYRRAFDAADVLLSPTAPIAPFALGERLEDPLTMYLTDAMTIPANLAGVPAISVPFGHSAEGLPIGVQLQAPFLGEVQLVRASAALEQYFGVSPPPAIVQGGES